MPVEVRPFQNTDTEPLCRIYREHYAAAGLPVECTPFSFEACIFAKPYFQAEHFLVATCDGELRGFAHLAYAPSEDLHSLSPTLGILSALCVSPGEKDDEIAKALCSAALELAKRQLARRLSYSPPPPASPYYVGLAPGDGMIGVPQSDQRLIAWLAAEGFQAGEAIVSRELDLAAFQPPVDRMQIQIRRMAHVDRLLDEPLMPWYQACVLGHTEQLGFQLTSRTAGRVTAEILLWNISSDIVPDPLVTTHLWPIKLGTASSDEFVFLLAEAFRQLRDERVERVVTISRIDDKAEVAALDRIGFVPTLTGNVFERTLPAI